MAWIVSHQELARHPKTRKLSRLLDVSLAQAIGHLHLLWYFAVDFAQDGDLTALGADGIADAAEWDGDAAQFVDALTSTKFIDRAGDVLILHEWNDYGGKTIERMEKERDKKRRQRGYSGAPPPCPATVPGDNTGTAQGSPNKVTATSPPCPVPNNNNDTNRDISSVGVDVPRTHAHKKNNGGKPPPSPQQIYRKKFGNRKPLQQTLDDVKFWFDHYHARDPTPSEHSAVETCYMIFMASCGAESEFSAELQAALEICADSSPENLAAYLIGVFKNRHEERLLTA